MGCKIIASGSYLPSNIVTNQDFELILETNDEWIRSRTGIGQRHIADEDEYCSHMAINAARNAIESSDIDASAIDLVIVATTTPDNSFPAVSVKVQAELCALGVPAFDLQAVCSGFIYALHVARSLIETKAHKNILIVGAEKMSSLLDYTDRSSCILFGDGAGAVILSHSDTNSGIIASSMHSDGSLYDILYADGGVSSTGDAGQLRMKGPEVFKKAIEGMTSACQEVLAQAGVTIDDVDYLIPHQANLRIIDAVGKKLAIDPQKVIKTVEHHANCSAASIPLAMSENFDKFKSGDLVLCCAFGAGLSWGANLIRW